MLSTRSWYLLDPHGVRFLLTSCQVLLGRVLKRLNECFSGLEMAGVLCRGCVRVRCVVQGKGLLGG